MTETEYAALPIADQRAVDECRDKHKKLCPYAGVKGCEYDTVGVGCWLNEQPPIH